MLGLFAACNVFSRKKHKKTDAILMALLFDGWLQPIGAYDPDSGIVFKLYHLCENQVLVRDRWDRQTSGWGQ